MHPRPLRPLALLAVAACGTSSTVAPPVDAGLTYTTTLPYDAGSPSEASARDVSAPPASPAPPPYPIVLMHGMAGFNQLANLPLTVSYFNGVQADLQAHGEPQVFVTIAPPYATTEVRAQALAPQLEAILKQTGAAKLNLIGHSQGGLDARILASPNGLGFADRVASITTIATPHRGTKVADVALGLIPGPATDVVSKITSGFLQLLEDGVYSLKTSPDLIGQATDMSTSYLTDTFNPKYIDAPHVIYASYAGRTNDATGVTDCADALYPNDPTSLDVPQVELQPTASYLSSQGETSDGLIPVLSAKWGTFMQCVPADHLKECGMLNQNGPDPLSGFDHLVFFRTVVARLRAQGL